MTGVHVLQLGAGDCVVAGLDWRSAPEGVQALLPGDHSNYALGSSAGYLIRHEGQVARAGEEIPAENTGSLLLAIARGLVTAENAPRAGVWLAAGELPADDGRDMYWLGAMVVSKPEVALDGQHIPCAFQPVTQSEEIIEGRGEFLRSLADLVSVMAVSGVAAADYGVGRHEALAAELRSELRAAADRQRDLVAPPVVGVIPKPDGTPSFTRRRRITAPMLGAGACGLAAMVALVVALPWIANGRAEPPPPPPELVRVEIPQGAFADACTAALAGWWPRIAGWETAERGCALAGHLPASLASSDLASAPTDGPPRIALAVWVKLERAAAANRILADSAARQVLTDWQHGQKLDDSELVLWQTQLLALSPTDGDGAPDEDREADSGTPAESLAALWAHRPGAVMADRGSYTVTAPGSAQALMDRASRVRTLEPVRLALPAVELPELVLRPRASRQVPKALFPDRSGAFFSISKLREGGA